MCNKLLRILKLMLPFILLPATWLFKLEQVNFKVCHVFVASSCNEKDKYYLRILSHKFSLFIRTTYVQYYWFLSNLLDVELHFHLCVDDDETNRTKQRIAIIVSFFFYIIFVIHYFYDFIVTKYNINFQINKISV